MKPELTIGAERRKYRTYPRGAYWATVYCDGAAIAQLGPYLRRPEALRAAYSMKQHREERPAMYNLPGQLTLPECEPDTSTLASRRKLPSKPQLPCDHGLFSDEAAQIDLIEMLQESVNGHD